MVLWLERDPRCGLTRLGLMRADAKGQHAAVGGKLILDLLQQAPALVSRSVSIMKAARAASSAKG
jgi:hypothetical protein